MIWYALRWLLIRVPTEYSKQFSMTLQTFLCIFREFPGPFMHVRFPCLSGLLNRVDIRQVRLSHNLLTNYVMTSNDNVWRPEMRAWVKKLWQQFAPLSFPDFWGLENRNFKFHDFQDPHAPRLTYERKTNNQTGETNRNTPFMCS